MFYYFNSVAETAEESIDENVFVVTYTPKNPFSFKNSSELRINIDTSAEKFVNFGNIFRVATIFSIFFLLPLLDILVGSILTSSSLFYLFICV